MSDHSFQIIGTIPIFHPEFRLAVCTAVSFHLPLWPQGILYYSSRLLNSWDVTVNSALFTLDCQFAVSSLPPFSVTLSFPPLSLRQVSSFFGNTGQWKERLDTKSGILWNSENRKINVFSSNTIESYVFLFCHAVNCCKLPTFYFLSR